MSGIIRNAQVKDGDKWVTAIKATDEGGGWLHYELRDGTIGLAKPGTWRIKPPKEQEG